MADGIRAQVEVAALDDCPVATASETSGGQIETVTRASAGANGTVSEDFVAPSVDIDIDASPITSDGENTVYRFERDRDDPCACDLIEQMGPPIADVTARDGSLQLTFHAEDVENVRAVIQRLKEQYETVRLRTLCSFDPEHGDDLVLVDRGRLTDKQRTVLTRAHELGYFEYPKGANAGEVADDLGIARSTFSEHLSAAQAKVLDAVLEQPPKS